MQGETPASHWKQYVCRWRHYLHLRRPGKIARMLVVHMTNANSPTNRNLLQDPVTFSIFDDILALDTNSWNWAQVDVGYPLRLKPFS